MPLPKLAVPEYDCTLPVSGQKVNFRPFLVKEEKLLYLAMESQKEKEMIKAVKTILKNCTDLKSVDDLPTFELEYLFLQIRSKAVGEVSEFKVVCQDDGETEVDVELDLNLVEVSVPKDHKKIVKLSDDVKIQMKYPALDVFVERNMTDDPSLDDVFALAAERGDGGGLSVVFGLVLAVLLDGSNEVLVDKAIVKVVARQANDLAADLAAEGIDHGLVID